MNESGKEAKGNLSRWRGGKAWWEYFGGFGGTGSAQSARKRKSARKIGAGQRQDAENWESIDLLTGGST
jgi:hypothetical protein